MEYPENLVYTKEHEWALIKEDIVTIGITEYAQDQLGDIVYVELPSVGDKLEKGNSFGVVESVKAVSDLYSPVSGEVVEVNGPVKDSPEIVNNDPFHEGWMVHVKISNPDELKGLMTPKEYQAFCEGSK